VQDDDNRARHGQHPFFGLDRIESVFTFLEGAVRTLDRIGIEQPIRSRGGIFLDMPTVIEKHIPPEEDSPGCFDRDHLIQFPKGIGFLPPKRSGDGNEQQEGK
jgi:hypothetical protein